MLVQELYHEDLKFKSLAVILFGNKLRALWIYSRKLPKKFRFSFFQIFPATDSMNIALKLARRAVFLIVNSLKDFF